MRKEKIHQAILNSLGVVSDRISNGQVVRTCALNFTSIFKAILRLA